MHAGRNKKTIVSFAETYQYIQKIYLFKKDYLIQPKLLLATINNCPMDVRILMQKRRKLWMITGEIVKVAANDFIITNAAQKLLSIMNALQASNIAHLNKKMLKAKIESICLTAAKVLENTKQGITIIGFDVGITLNGEIWIIEGNYQPDLSMFFRANDKTIYMNLSKESKS
ncbi:YheC/YheD family protein [Bacillus sp. Bva_UNVM-123]